MFVSLLSAVGPFALAAGAGTTLALMELLRSFDRGIGEALRNRWAWALLGLNALVACAVYAIVDLLTADGTNPIILALIVGSTFPAILRSRFTFYRNPGDGGANSPSELSLPIDKFYTTIQDRCYTEVNIELASQRNGWATRIADSDFDLVRFLPNVIQAGTLVDRRAEYERKYSEIREKYLDQPERQRHLLALLYIDIMPRGEVRKRLRQIEKAAAPQVRGVPAASPPG
jgi:hypothetical protein